MGAGHETCGCDTPFPTTCLQPEPRHRRRRPASARNRATGRCPSRHPSHRWNRLGVDDAPANWNAFAAQAPDTSIEVIPALGSTGAIAAVVDGALDFAVSARPLTPEEVAKSLTPTIMARTVFGLASSYPKPGNIASSDVAGFFTSPASSWPDGTPLRIILRPKSEFDTTLLAKAFPNMAGAIEQLRLRPEIPVAATDQDNVRMAERIPGSLVPTTLAQMQTEKPKLHFLTIDGVAPTLENFERGTYPHHKDLYFILPAQQERLTRAFRRLPAFPRGRKTVA